MSRKLIIKPTLVIEDGYMGAEIVQDPPTNIQYVDRATVQLIWTGTPVGDFSIETSLDYSPPLDSHSEDNSTWTALNLSPAPVAAGTAGNWVVDISQTAVPYLRVKYTPTSGDGYLSCYISGKES